MSEDVHADDFGFTGRLVGSSLGSGGAFLFVQPFIGVQGLMTKEAVSVAYPKTLKKAFISTLQKEVSISGGGMSSMLFKCLVVLEHSRSLTSAQGLVEIC